MVICLEQGADLHTAQLMPLPLPLTVSCFSKIQIGLPFWYWLTRVVPEKGPLNGCVCVCVEWDVKPCSIPYYWTKGESHNSSVVWPGQDLAGDTALSRGHTEGRGGLAVADTHVNRCDLHRCDTGGGACRGCSCWLVFDSSV